MACHFVNRFSVKNIMSYSVFLGSSTSPSSLVLGCSPWVEYPSIYLLGYWTTSRAVHCRMLDTPDCVGDTEILLKTCRDRSGATGSPGRTVFSPGWSSNRNG